MKLNDELLFNIHVLYDVNSYCFLNVLCVHVYYMVYYLRMACYLGTCNILNKGEVDRMSINTMF